MTEAMFIDALRQYASMARKQHRSYAAQVGHIYGLYLDHLASKADNGTALHEGSLRANKFLKNEYAPWDKEFQLPTDA